MEYTRLGATDISISKICFGCWAIGGHGYGNVDDKKSIAAIHKALELGINFFDTADVYGLGHSEKVLGAAIRGKKNVIVASKFGVAWDANGTTRKDCSVKRLNQSIEQSLRRLKRECIDLYQIHWHDGITPIDELMQALVKLKDQGKIRCIGCSNLSRELIIEASRETKIESVQLLYCLNDFRREEDIYFFNSDCNMTTLVYGVLGRGIFSGKYSHHSRFLENDTRGNDPNFNENLKKNLCLLRTIKKISLKYDKTPSQVVIRWVLDNRAVSCALLGMKSLSQVIDNIGGLGWILTEEDNQVITKKASDLFQ